MPYPPLCKGACEGRGTSKSFACLSQMHSTSILPGLEAGRSKERLGSEGTSFYGLLRRLAAFFSAPYQHSTRLAFWSFRHVCKCNESGMFPMEIIAHPRGPRNYLQFARGGSRCMKDLVRNRKGLQVSGGGIQPTRQKQATVGMCFNQITTLYTFRTPVGCVLWIRMLTKGLKQQLGWKSNVPCSHCLAQKLMMFVSLSGEVSAPNIASCDRHCGHRHLRGQLAGMGAPNGSLM